MVVDFMYGWRCNNVTKNWVLERALVVNEFSKKLDISIAHFARPGGMNIGIKVLTEVLAPHGAKPSAVIALL